LNITLRQTHLAGEKLFVDYSGKKVPIVDPDTKQKWFAEFFVATLGASNYTYAEASPSQKIHHWIGSNVNALEFFGGVPKLIVPDNLKSAVVKNSKGEVVLNKQYIEFARHYRTAIIPTRPGKPKDKSKVEGAVRIAQTRILAKLRHKTFNSVAEANNRLKNF
jgi:transposase